MTSSQTLPDSAEGGPAPLPGQGTNRPGRLAPDTSQLLLIDFQARLAPAIAAGEARIAAARLLLRAARELGVPVLATEQYPAGLGPTVPALAALAGPPFEKLHFAATDAPGFTERLLPGRTLVIAGMEAHVCVLQTALGCLELGLAVAVVADAVGSRRSEDRRRALARLAAAGAVIVTAEMVVFEWLGSAGTEVFRQLLPAIRDRG